MTTHGVAPHPLYWPLQHARTPATRRRSAQFRVDFATARDQLLRELKLLSARDVVLSSNVPIRRDGLPTVPDKEPDDPGVAVYFGRVVRQGTVHPFVIACDQFYKVRWNVRAIGATIEALRSIERNGTTQMLEQAFSGFLALPPGPEPVRLAWREVLGVMPDIRDPEVVRAAYKGKAFAVHPDRGGSSVELLRVQQAYEDARAELGFT